LSTAAHGPAPRTGVGRRVRLLAAAALGLAGAVAVLAAWVGWSVTPGRPVDSPGRLLLYAAAGLLGVAVPALAARAVTGRWDAAGLLLALGPPASLGLLLVTGLA
jgi:hypothetical protein